MGGRRNPRKRALKTLQRIADRRSVPDWGGMSLCEKYGWLKVHTMADDPSLESGELRYEITSTGHAALERSDAE